MALAEPHREPAREAGVPRPLVAAAVVLGAAALGLTWWRLQRGADLVDEAFSVLVPWRWALGDRPFVDEQNLSQSAGLLTYPFAKLYALVGGNDPGGLVLYDRYLYLALAVLTATCVALLARRSLPLLLAALVALPYVTVVLFETPQLTPNTLCALLLSIAAALGAVTVLGGPRGAALLAGVAFGLAGIAYPTVLLLSPFVAVLLAFSVGEHGVPTSAGRGVTPAPSGLRAWRLVSAWALGGALVVAPVVLAVFAIAGTSNLQRCWDYTISLARRLDQLGGTAKAGEISTAFVSLLVDQWYIVAAALVSLLVFRLRPAGGRWLLLLTPPAVWLTGTAGGMGAAGAVILYALAAPYLYLFLPPRRREDGVRLLVCVWAPALAIGAMTAYTSADGFVRAAVGLLSGLVVSGLFLAWGLEPLGSRRGGVWWAAAGLAAIVVATLAFQVQFQQGGVRPSELDTVVASGPWKGIALTAAQGRLLNGYSGELSRHGRPGDLLLAYPQASAFYLYWPGEVAANTYQLYAGDPASPLPDATVSYYRRHREVPTLVVHLQSTAGKPPGRLRAESGGLDYPPVAIRPGYAILRKPPAESVDEVLARLPRL
jgi:hypothetical protein